MSRPPRSIQYQVPVDNLESRFRFKASAIGDIPHIQQS